MRGQREERGRREEVVNVQARINDRARRVRVPRKKNESSQPRARSRETGSERRPRVNRDRSVSSWSFNRVRGVTPTAVHAGRAHTPV